MKIEDYNEYYIQGTDHYLIPKDNFEELFNEMVNWKEESQNLLSVFNKAKENFEQEVKTKIVLTKQKGKRDIIPTPSFGKTEKTYQRPTYIS